MTAGEVTSDPQQIRVSVSLAVLLAFGSQLCVRHYTTSVNADRLPVMASNLVNVALASHRSFSQITLAVVKEQRGRNRNRRKWLSSRERMRKEKKKRQGKQTRSKIYLERN